MSFVEGEGEGVTDLIVATGGQVLLPEPQKRLPKARVSFGFFATHHAGVVA